MIPATFGSLKPIIEAALKALADKPILPPKKGK